MEKIWLASYPPGVPSEIDLEEFSSLVDLFLTSVEKHAARPAFGNMGATLTFAELERSSRAFAAFLQTEIGLGKGDRLAIMMPNVLAYPVALFGALRAGAVVVNVNPLYTARELREQLVDSGASTIVVLENFGHVLGECIAQVPVEHVIVARIGDLLGSPKGPLVNFVVKHVKRLVPAYALPGAVQFGEALARGEKHVLAPIPLERDDLALLQYTGGTTGAAKGAMLTHGNMVANVQQATAWMAPVVEEGAETVVTALPLYHIFALTANCLSFVKIGGLNVLITNPRDLRAFVKELARVRFTVITGVNTLFNALLNTPGFTSLDFGALKLALGGGMAVQRSVAERWKEVTGIALVEAYGLTETAPAVCINPLDAEEFSGSIGLPVSSTECMVRDEDGRELGVGEVGELCVRGPQVMKGYWQRPEETAKCLDAEGWLATGDVARIDERGYVYLVDRKKDVIIVSGFNVFPNEIEEVVSAHPDVLEVGAIGVADEHSGEVVKVVIVKRNPGLTRESIEAYCRENLAGYKRPKLVEFAPELPKSNVGKILRRELRSRYGGAE